MVIEDKTSSLEDRKNPLKGFGSAVSVARVGFTHARRTVKKTEDIDKFTKVVTAILKTFEFFSLEKIYPAIKNVRLSTDNFSKTVGAFNILGRIAEAADGFYTKATQATWKGIDFKRISRGFLFAGHTCTTVGFIGDIAGLGRYTKHFIANAPCRLIPGVGVLMDSLIWISAVLNVVANSLILQSTNQADSIVKKISTLPDGSKKVIKGMSSVRLSKWSARIALFDVKNDDKVKIDSLKAQYIGARLKLGASKTEAENKWNVLVNSEVLGNKEKYTACKNIADHHVKLYQHQSKAVANTRHKAVIGIIYDIFKAAIIALAITSAVLTALAVTLPFTLAPSFIVLGLLTAGLGFWKAIADSKSNKDAKKSQEFNLQIPTNLVRNYYKEALSM